MTMVISEKRLVANKRNARNGGVKTAEGKAITRLNAVSHGLLCREVLLATEEGEALAEVEAHLLEEFCPQGQLERLLVDRIVTAFWRLRRVLVAERANMQYEYQECLAMSYPYGQEARSQKALGSMVGSERTERIVRYEAAIERQLYRALHELIRLQMARNGDRPMAPLAVDIDISSSR